MRWLLLSLVVACSSPTPARIANSSPASTAPDPRAFALRLIETLEHDDVTAWNQLLSSNLRSRIDDEGMRTQLQTWRRDLLPKAHGLRAASFSLDRSGPQHFVLYSIQGHEPEALAMVIEEHGVLKLDEN